MKEKEAEARNPIVFVLDSTEQPIGPFADSTPYQISGIGNPNTDPRYHQIRLPTEFDQTDITLTTGIRSFFIVNTGPTPIETVSYRSQQPSTPDSCPLKTTLEPGQSLGLNFRKTAATEVSWLSEQNKNQQHITARFTFDQEHRQIEGSCEVRPIPHS